MIPHLMNCQHQGEGWCLACVCQLHSTLATAERERDEARKELQSVRVCFAEASHRDCQAGPEIEALKKERDEAREACAVKDEALKTAENCDHTYTQEALDLIRKALASDCGGAILERLRRAEEANEKFSLELANGTIALRQMTNSNLAALSRCRELEGVIEQIQESSETPDRIHRFIEKALSSSPSTEKPSEPPRSLANRIMTDPEMEEPTGKMSFPEMLKAAEADPSFHEEYERLTGKRYEPSERESVAKEVADGLADAMTLIHDMAAYPRECATDLIGHESAEHELRERIASEAAKATAAYRSHIKIGGRVE